MLLVLAALAAGRAVPVSRGESVEIGGGFRVPEVMAQSGARLVDVGTTNRTRLADYRRAVDADDVALVLKVHPSNYRVDGFVEDTSVAELATLGPPVVVDLGSGLVDATCPWWPGPHPPPWLAGEPAAVQTLAAGAALVTFSGDKLLGGPQAGIIAGRADLVARCAAHPLARALRPGGLVLAALQDLVARLPAPRRRGDGAVLADGRHAGRRPAARGPRRSPPPPATTADRHRRAPGRRVGARRRRSRRPVCALDGDHLAALRAPRPAGDRPRPRRRHRRSTCAPSSRPTTPCVVEALRRCG